MSTGTAPSTPALKIPIALDYSKALAQLKRMQDKLAETGQEAKKAEKEMQGIGATLAEMASHQGYQILKDAASAMGEGFRDAAKYIKDVAQEYVGLRRDLQVVAALKGVGNSGSFTADQARAAKAAGLTPTEAVDFQKAWLTAAGAFLGGPQAKMDDADAQKFETALATFAKARSIDVEDVANVGGSVLQFAEKKLTYDDAMKRVAGTFNAMEPAPGELGPLLSKSSQVMSLGASAEEAGQLMHLSTLIDKREGAAYIKQLILQLNAAGRDEAKAKELGIDSKMGPLEKVRKAAETVSARAANGENVDDVVSKYISDANAIVALGAMVRQGVQGGAFDRVKDLVDKTPAGYLEKQVDDYRASDEGMQAQADANLAANRVIAGEPYSELTRLKTSAEAKLTEEGALTSWYRSLVESPRLGVLNKITSMWTAGSTEEQMILERVRGDAYEKWRAAGGAAAGDWDASAIESRYQRATATDANTVAFLKMIEQHLAKIAGATTQKPLSASPPAPRTRP